MAEILNRVIRVGVIEKETFGQRFEGCERGDHVDIWGTMFQEE